MTESEELFEYLLLDRAQQVGEALGAVLLLSAGGGVLIHCRAGKDRLGHACGYLHYPRKPGTLRCKHLHAL